MPDHPPPPPNDLAYPEGPGGRTKAPGSSEKLTMRHAERPSVQGRVMVYPKAFRHPVACPPAAPPPRRVAFAEVAAVKVEPIPGKKLTQSSKKCFQGYLAMGEGEFALKPARSPCSDEFLGTLRGQGNQESPTDLHPRHPQNDLAYPEGYPLLDIQIKF